MALLAIGKENLYSYFKENAVLIAKKTSKNQITLPKAIVEKLPAVDYFEVSLKGGSVILKPVVSRSAGDRLRAVRSKMRALGLTEKDVDAAIRWARVRRG